MTTIDFNSTKETLIQKGLVIASQADEATQTVVLVEGNWNRDGSATVKQTSAGWVIGGLSKVVPVQFDVPQTENKFDNAGIKAALEASYPGTFIIVKIA